MRQMAQVGSWKGDGSRLWRDCRGEACLARRVRSTRIAHIAIIHSQTSLSVIAGEVLYPPPSILRARRASPLLLTINS